MAKVPYNPIPQVSPPRAGSPQNVNIRISPNAFGANVGEATMGFARQVERSADEIYSRGVALQELNNQAEKDDLAVRATNAIAEEKNKFDMLLGRSASDDLVGFRERIEKTRMEIGNEATNPTVRKMYDNETRRMLTQTNFAAGRHAATENKKYLVKSLDSSDQAAIDEALINPLDEVAAQASRQKIAANAIKRGELLGWDNQSIDQSAADAISKQWAQRVDKVRKTDPVEADRLLKQGRDSGQLRGEALFNTENRVRSEVRTTGSAVIANKIFSGRDISLGDRPIPMATAKSVYAILEGNKSYLSEGPVIQKGAYAGDRAYGMYQVMGKNIPAWTKQYLGKEMTIQEFLKDSDAQDRLFEAKFGGDMAKHGSFNQAASIWFSGKPLEKISGKENDGYLTVPQYVEKANSILARKMPLSDVTDLATRRASEQVPDDPEFPSYAEQKAKAEWDRRQGIERDTSIRRQIVVTAAMNGGEDGDLPNTVEEFIAKGPEAKFVWESADSREKAKILNDLRANHNKERVRFTQEGLALERTLEGMATSPDPAQRLKFLETDLDKQKILTVAQIRKLGTLQNRVMNKQPNDPRLETAVKIGLEVVGRKFTYNVSPSRNDMFRGAMNAALTQWREDNPGKQPQDEDFRTMANRVTQDVEVPGRFFGTTTDPLYDVSVPKKEYDRIKAMPKWQELGGFPTDAQIKRVYQQELYTKRWGKTPTSAPKIPLGPPKP